MKSEILCGIPGVTVSYLKSFSVLTFVAFFSFGFFFLFKNQNLKYVYITVDSKERLPAAIRDSEIFHNLTQKPIRVPIEEEFLKTMKVVNTPSVAALELNQFATANSEGEMTLACLVFNKVELLFEAEGQATAGQKPSLKVTSPCQISGQNVNQVRTVIIPTQEIKNRKAQNGTFQFDSLPGVNFEARSINTEWPKIWVLQSVTFSSEKKSLVFDTITLLDETSFKQTEIPYMVW